MSKIERPLRSKCSQLNVFAVSLTAEKKKHNAAWWLLINPEMQLMLRDKVDEISYMSFAFSERGKLCDSLTFINHFF